MPCKCYLKTDMKTKQKKIINGKIIHNDTVIYYEWRKTQMNQTNNEYYGYWQRKRISHEQMCDFLRGNINSNLIQLYKEYGNISCTEREKNSMLLF